MAASRHFPRTPFVLFVWVRFCVWRRQIRQLFESPAKLSLIVGVWLSLLVGVFALAYYGFQFVYDTAGLGPFLLSRLWFLFLFVIMILMATSHLASAFSTIVRTPETRWWITLPVSARTICRAKGFESTLYSAWAVVILLLPTCLAYVVVLKKPLWLVGWIIGVLLVPMLGIVTAFSTMVLLAWLRWARPLMIRREVAFVGLWIVSCLLFWLLGERQVERQQDVWFIALQELLPRMQVAMSMGWPSSWAATGIDAGMNGRWLEGSLYASLLWTTALLSWRILDHGAARWLFRVLRDVARPVDAASWASRPSSSPRLVPVWWMRRALFSSIAKDVLFVLRDPMQWSQGLLFFGLLGAYFGNLHRFGYAVAEPSWRIGIAALNCACTLLVFGSLAVRFIFPQMSLEGRALWLLRISPGGLSRQMVSKICLYGFLAVGIVDGLLLVSTGRLSIPSPIRLWLLGAGLISSLAIVGLSVGLGCLWIDPTAQDAARVVSSSNGAMALILMLAYVSCVVVGFVGFWLCWMHHSPTGLFGISLSLVGVSMFTGWVPMRLGLKRMERLE